jgi:endo-1,4-beta-xylanase
MYNLKFFLTLTALLTLTACGGGGGNTSPVPLNSSSSMANSSASSEADTSLSLKALADFPIGVAVSAGTETHSILYDNANGETQRAIIEQHFDQITAGNIMKMSYLHSDINTFFYTHADALLDYATENELSIHAHALVWHSDYQVPDWMKNFEGDKAAWMVMMKTHVETIAGNYSGRVPSWDVVNEAFNDDGSYRNSLFFQNMGADYIEAAFVNTRAADGAVELYYNDYSLSPGGPKLNAVLNMVDDFKARDIPIDGIGFQMHIYMDYPAIGAIRSSFKAVVDRGLKVKVTELDIPINNPYSDNYSYPDNYVSEFTPAIAQQQKVRYCEIMEAYLDVVPAHLRGGFTVWGVWDGDTWLNSVLFDNQHEDWPLLFDHDFNPKPALDGVAAALKGEACN